MKNKLMTTGEVVTILKLYKEAKCKTESEKIKEIQKKGVKRNDFTIRNIINYSLGKNSRISKNIKEIVDGIQKKTGELSASKVKKTKSRRPSDLSFSLENPKSRDFLIEVESSLQKKKSLKEISKAITKQEMSTGGLTLQEARRVLRALNPIESKNTSDVILLSKFLSPRGAAYPCMLNIMDKNLGETKPVIEVINCKPSRTPEPDEIDMSSPDSIQIDFPTKIKSKKENSYVKKMVDISKKRRLEGREAQLDPGAKEELSKIVAPPAKEEGTIGYRLSCEALEDIHKDSETRGVKIWDENPFKMLVIKEMSSVLLKRLQEFDNEAYLKVISSGSLIDNLSKLSYNDLGMPKDDIEAEIISETKTFIHFREQEIKEEISKLKSEEEELKGLRGILDL